MRHELLRSLIGVATIALLAQTLGRADEPRLGDPSPKQILDRMAKAYGDCKSYRDAGVVKTVLVLDTGNRTDEKPFTTAFVRPDQFRFQYKAKVGNRQLRSIIWSNGNEIQTWWDTKPGIQKPKSLQLAVGGATGVSGGSAARIPGMLMPGKTKGWGGVHISDAKRIEDGKLEKTDCFRLEGQYGDNPITLWIDKKSYLVRRIDEQAEFDNFRTETTTTYDPTVDGKIADEMLEFGPPVQK